MSHPLEETLAYRFQSPSLLKRALTHRSLDGDNNQRLEFLGDRVLGLVVAHLLFEQFPNEQEGELARRHAALVNKHTLAEVAVALDLGSHLHLSGGEEASGGRENPSHLEDACEALIGALYLDGGFPAAQAFLERYWKPMLLSIKEPPKDAKTALQEWAQARGLALPDYVEIDRRGPAHAPEFEIEVRVGENNARAIAGAKRTAEQAAAEKLLAELEG